MVPAMRVARAFSFGVGPVSGVALLISTNGLFDSFPFQSLPAVIENEIVLCLDFIDCSLLALDNCRLLALVSAVSDNDLFTYRKACHHNLPW
jgi:hypothetical protein